MDDLGCHHLRIPTSQKSGCYALGESVASLDRGPACHAACLKVLPDEVAEAQQHVLELQQMMEDEDSKTCADGARMDDF